MARWPARARLLYLLMLLAVTMFCVTYGNAQILCYITNTNVSPGQGASVPAGQPVEFTIAITGSCPAPGIYTIRADIINPSTSNVLSTNRIQLVANGQFSTVLTESAVAPTSVGPWSLQVSVYVLFNGAVVGPASQQTFGLNIIPYTPTSAVVTTQSTTEVSSLTTSSSVQSATTSQTSLLQITSIITTTESTGDNTLLFARLAALATVIVLVMIAIMARRRSQRAKKEHTRVY